ncbi:MAG: IS66 family transposase [Proteobacteria bacterium]|nr:IS66 family transposase [Pseudomonadota bacterium]
MDAEKAAAVYMSGRKVVVDLLCAQNDLVLALRRNVEELEKANKDLEMKISRLSKNSSNSGKPPSSDDITKPKRDGKKNSGRKKGGRKGHPKHERPPFSEEELDKSENYDPPCCPECRSSDLIPLPDIEPRIVQQVELKEAVVSREEHRSYAYWCEKCENVHYAPFPPEIVAEGFFKARITATVAYMKNVGHVSFSTIGKFFRDILNQPISRGYPAKIIGKVSGALDRPYEELLELLPLEEKLNIDETGHKNNGDRFWTWVFKAELYALFRIDKSRGSNVLIDVLGEGVVGCDYFSAYRKYMKDFNVSIQYCLAHLIRNIKYLTGLPDKETKAYGEKLLEAYRNLFKTIHERESVTATVFNTRLDEARKTILKTAIDEVPSRLDSNGREEKREAKNMADRFILHGEAYFTFMTTPGIEPTNNAAERAIRFVVIDRLITQGTRSVNGRKASERLWTVVATCDLQGRSAFEFIHKAVKADFCGTAPPSLVPDTS